LNKITRHGGSLAGDSVCSLLLFRLHALFEILYTEEASERQYKGEEGTESAGARLSDVVSPTVSLCDKPVLGGRDHVRTWTSAKAHLEKGKGGQTAILEARK